MQINARQKLYAFKNKSVVQFGSSNISVSLMWFGYRVHVDSSEKYIEGLVSLKGRDVYWESNNNLQLEDTLFHKERTGEHGVPD